MKQFFILANVKHLVDCSVAHPDLFWYGLSGMGAQKRFSKIRYIHACYVKTKWNILRILQKQKPFQKTQISPQRHRIPNMASWYDFTFFHTTVIPIEYTNFEKMVCPKHAWTRHCCFHQTNLYYNSRCSIGQSTQEAFL